ncbi:hypothetical protein [Thiospirochaeta perfilievii]|uniref:hypothetical protein n=1 Tax=Thiospirochaeta perfilievii TaxID=252967 RepID=UPI001659EC6E|nr:hypothetical protein [Thiospirochaeta perfilievii]
MVSRNLSGHKPKGVNINQKSLFLNFSYQKLTADMVRRRFKKYLELSNLDGQEFTP